MMRSFVSGALAAGLVAVALVGCGGADSKGKATASSSPCRKVAAPSPHRERTQVARPTGALPAGSVWDVTLVTNCGAMTVRVDAGISPRAAASFVSLARSGFYNGLSFHRIVPGFVIQGGDPLGNGLGGPGYTTVDRPDPGQAYTRGTVAMAKSPDQPAGAGGSQFFIVTGEEAQLPAEYAVLGRVSQGGGTADLITSVGVDPKGQVPGGTPDGRPASPVVIETVSVRRVA